MKLNVDMVQTLTRAVLKIDSFQVSGLIPHPSLWGGRLKTDLVGFESKRFAF